MASKSGIRMYEEVIKDICKVESLDEKKNDKETQESIYGIAMCLAFINGVENDVVKMADHLGIFYKKLLDPFDRLTVNGIFGNRYNLKNDPIFQGKYREDNQWISSAHKSECAWCHIAGIASGITGLKEEVEN